MQENDSEPNAEVLLHGHRLLVTLFNLMKQIELSYFSSREITPSQAPQEDFSCIVRKA